MEVLICTGQSLNLLRDVVDAPTTAISHGIGMITRAPPYISNTHILSSTLSTLRTYYYLCHLPLHTRYLHTYVQDNITKLN